MKNILIVGAALAGFLLPLTLQAADFPVRHLQAFRQEANELPEGIAVRGDSLYVGFATSQHIVRLDEEGSHPVTRLPALAPGKGFMTGLAFDGEGSLYAALASFDPMVQTGIYRYREGDAAPVLFASHPEMILPNDFVTLPDGDFLVSDSFAGRIWRVDGHGRVTEWLKHDLLTGDPMTCAPDEVGVAIGINGMDIGPDKALYVASTDRAIIVRIAIEDGRAGVVSTLNMPDCALLEGADGIKATAKGIVVAANRTDQLSLVGYDGTVSSLAMGQGIDFPASIVEKGGELIVTNFALIRAGNGKGKPGLIAIPVPR